MAARTKLHSLQDSFLGVSVTSLRSCPVRALSLWNVSTSIAAVARADEVVREDVQEIIKTQRNIGSVPPTGLGGARSNHQEWENLTKTAGDGVWQCHDCSDKDD